MWIISGIGDTNDVCCAKPLYYLSANKYSKKDIETLTDKLNDELEDKNIACLDAINGFNYQFVSKYDSMSKALHKIANI